MATTASSAEAAAALRMNIISRELISEVISMMAPPFSAGKPGFSQIEEAAH